MYRSSQKYFLLDFVFYFLQDIYTICTPWKRLISIHKVVNIFKVLLSQLQTSQDNKKRVNSQKTNKKPVYCFLNWGLGGLRLPSQYGDMLPQTASGYTGTVTIYLRHNQEPRGTSLTAEQVSDVHQKQGIFSLQQKHSPRHLTWYHFFLLHYNSSHRLQEFFEKNFQTAVNWSSDS